LPLKVRAGIRTINRSFRAPRLDPNGSGWVRQIDRFHEEALVADTPDGLVVVVGCAHPGIITMLKQISAGVIAIGAGRKIR
jgi:metal-dependent hydrolase (beta-lactamase superfamily II)